jgi:hypothetical protein
VREHCERGGRHGLTRKLFSFALVLAALSIPAVAQQQDKGQSETEM